MFYVSQVISTPPKRFDTPLQEQVYRTLEALKIPYTRVATDPAITMGDCLHVDRGLGVKIVKTLFLCNRQQTAFYLFITPGDKPFSTKHFSHALSVPRVSFASPEQLLEMMGTQVGAATVMSALVDLDQKTQIVIDQAAAQEEWFGCSDGTATGFLKLKTRDLLDRLLPFTRHTPILAEVTE